MLLEMKKISVCLLLVFMGVCLLPSLLFAADDFYDAAGFVPHRETYGIAEFEQIDPFTGGLILNFEDMRLPGNGGLDLVIQRTFNSKNVCRDWVDVGGVTSCNSINAYREESWVGVGWSLHMGKLWVKTTATTNPNIVEMPDGSRHEAYNRADGSGGFITRDYWKLDQVGGTYVLTMTDGKKITYGHFAGTIEGAQYNEYFATKIEDANGNAITITYWEPDGTADNIQKYAAIKSITDSNSPARVTYFNLTTSLIGGRYRLASIQRPDGKLINFSYTAVASPQSALLQSVQPPVGDPWVYTYNTATTLHEVKTVTTPYGGTVQYVFGTSAYNYTVGAQNFRTVKQKTTGGAITAGTWSFLYFQNSTKDYTTITDPCGRTITYRHYGYSSGLSAGDMWKMGLLISKEVVGEETTNYTWAKSAAQISNDRYQLIISTWYDTAIYVPNLSVQTITRDGRNYTTTYSNFDSYGNPKNIAETGNGTRNRSISNYWYNTTRNIVHGKPLSETVTGSLSGSYVTSYDYGLTTSSGNLLTLTKYGVGTTYTYYPNGNRWTMTDANNKTATYEWQNGQISKISNTIPYSVTKVINPNGTVANVTDGRGTGYTTYYGYDDNLRLRSIDPPVGNTTIIDYPNPDNSVKRESRGGYWLETYFDGLGRTTGSLDSKSVMTTVAWKACGLKDYTTSNIGDKVYYDNFGRTTQIVHKDNYQILYDYSVANQVTVTDEAGKNTTLYYTAFGSPDDKMLTSVKDAAVPPNTTTYSRNILGSLTGTAQGSLTRSFNFNNAHNFLDDETHPESGQTTYGRYNTGHLKTKTDYGFNQISYDIDAINRLKTITYDTGHIDLGYDNADNRNLLNSPSASATYHFDAANRMEWKKETIAGIQYTTQYTYDDNDNLKTITYPTGLLVTYYYDMTKNQVTSAIWTGGGVTGITYNLAGQPEYFTYANLITTHITPNNRFFPSRIQAGNAYDTGFTYYPNGNTWTITDNLPATAVLTHKIDTAKGSLQTTNYGYSSNRMTSLTGSETVSYGYNGRGDMTSLTENNVTYTPVYDLLHNLTAYNQGPTTIASYGYDGDGLRVTKTAGGVTTVYHHDKGGKLLSETDTAGNRIADYIYVNGNMAAKVDSTGVSYYHVDPAGTPTAITDSTGALVWRAEYLPFGEEQLLVNNKANDKMFVGKEKDEETGLYYFGARYMQDRNGRFVSVDSVGPVDPASSKTNEKMLTSPQKLNRYAYALNNPYRFVDPDGKWPEQVHNEIIKRAFGNAKYVAALQQGSIEADTMKYQDPAHNYMHAMRSAGQSAEEAAGLTATFIMHQIGEYKRLKAAGQTDEAYKALGMAMHPLMDNTSPSHNDFQVWESPYAHPIDANTHKTHETLDVFNSNADYSERSVDAIRRLYNEANK